MFLHLQQLLRKTEFIVDSGASLHMLSTSELTPEEQETIQKSKDPITHTPEEAPEKVCDLDMFVQVQFTKNHARYFLWENGRGMLSSRRAGR